MIGISDPKLPEQPEATTQVSTLRPYSLAFHPFRMLFQILFELDLVFIYLFSMCSGIYAVFVPRPQLEVFPYTA